MERDKETAEQLRLEAADGGQITWPEATAPQREQTAPFLGTLMERGIAVTVARELVEANQQLQQENETLAYKAGKYDQQMQRSRDSYYKQKAADHEGLKEKQRVRQANYRARKRLEAKTQEAQKPRDNRS